MRTWNSLSEQEKLKVRVYAKYLRLENPTELQKKESLILTRYCVEKNICIGELMKGKK